MVRDTAGIAAGDVTVRWPDSGTRGAEAGRDGLPGVRVGMGTGEMQHEAAHRARDAHADLQEDKTETADLCTRQRRAIGAQLQFLEQDVRGRGQGDTELIGPEL